MAATAEHTPLRLAEKHYKNRSLCKYGLTPSLRAAPTSSLPDSSSVPDASNGLQVNGTAGPSYVRRRVVDLSRPANPEDDDVYLAGWWSTENDAAQEYLKDNNGQTGELKRWLKSYRKGKDRELGERPDEVRAFKRVRVGGNWGYVVAEGCILIPQYLDPATQFSLASSALSSYTRKPNPLSLDTHYSTPSDLFSLYASHSPTHIPPLFESLSAEEQAAIRAEQASAAEGRKTIETAAAATIGYDEARKRNLEYERDKGGRDRPSGTLRGRTAGELMREIRWANLGWVYQWSTKSYDFTPAEPIPFPQPLAKMCSGIVQQIPWDEVYDGVQEAPDGYDQWARDYGRNPNAIVPDTGIVNFYQSADTLMAHVDRAELDPARPLVSISLGHSCIFLLGTSSRHSPPLPMILRSGDVFIMSGRGRQAYHGVPRIMEGCLPKHFHPLAYDGQMQGEDGDAGEEGDATDRAVREWMATARVNINVRQVFPPGFERPHD